MTLATSLALGFLFEGWRWLNEKLGVLGDLIQILLVPAFESLCMLLYLPSQPRREVGFLSVVFGIGAFALGASFHIHPEILAVLYFVWCIPAIKEMVYGEAEENNEYRHDPAAEALHYLVEIPCVSLVIGATITILRGLGG